MLQKLLHLLLDLVLLIAWTFLAYRLRRHNVYPFVFTFLAGNSLVDLGNSWKAITSTGTMSPTSPPKWLIRLLLGG